MIRSNKIIASSTAAGSFTSSLMAYIQTDGDTDDWYQLNATDTQNSCMGYIRVQLTVPAGDDYDAYLYFTADGTCGGATLVAEGINSGSEDFTWDESCSVNDSGWYLVRVHRYSGSSCSMPYTLTVTANL